MKNTPLILTPEQVATARDWCVECWPDQSDEIAEASPEVIQGNIGKFWAGGLDDFIECNPAPVLDAGLFGDY